ncbi:MAG: RsmF rRNA methyltransferase first C-terminal domain-containing protein [Candidatus Bathyarchaeia archaeon]|nr:RsmF rRNA methyltransferase first C-terminal domain-containing protein [Candidatus Bathyarchaeota archaeon]
MANPLKEFMEKLNAAINFDEALIEEKGGKIFLLNNYLRSTIDKVGLEYLHAGIYLGSIKQNRFIPSFPLLFMLADKVRKKIYLTDKAAWLFICGRDIFAEGILHIEGSINKGDLVMLFNKHGECLGYGMVKQDPKRARIGVVIKNIMDIGDFLRREKQL